MELVLSGGTIGVEADRELRPTSRLVTLVERVHGSARSWVAVAVDAAIATGAALATGVRPAVIPLGVLVLVLGIYMGRGYAERSSLETQGVLWYPAAVAAPIAVASLVLLAAAGTLGLTESKTATFAVTTVALLVVIRSVTWAFLAMARRAGWGLRPTLIIGEGVIADTVRQKLMESPQAGLRPVGTLAPAAMSTLPERIERDHVVQVVAIPEGNLVDLGGWLEECGGRDVQVAMLPPLTELFLNPGRVSQVGGLPLLPVGRAGGLQRTTLPGKRVFDAIVASLLLLVLAPLLTLVTLAIKLDDGGPVLFRQRRVGRNGRPFEILKFRSMRLDAEEQIIDLRDANLTDGLLFKMRNDPRVTRVGALIRRLSVDELPQLWNVIRGEMSLVGPRPLAVDPDDFGPMDGRRHEVLPGITGYWQVAGGNGLTYAEMIKLDMAYIQNWSLWLDVRLLLRTFGALADRSRPC